ncbi:MAG: sigma-54-dependent Fis family transcriptional regulator [Candidatus Riflebacteria bacterium]|nr:sigma-54-dependent Fis family transcriptional regulator [Candidatus Riflebacteria bacterium]
MSKRILACQSNPLSLLLIASQYDPTRDRVEIIRSDTIIGQLESWIRESSLEEILFVAESVGSIRQELRDLLASAVEKKIAIRVVCKETSNVIIDACESLRGVKTYTAADLFTAMKKTCELHEAAQKLIHSLSQPNSTIDAYIRVSLSLAVFDWVPMKQGRSEKSPIHELVSFLSDLIYKRHGRFEPGPNEEQLITLFRNYEFPYLEGSSEKIVTLRKYIEKVAPTDLNTLIIGETGTGKEAVAFFLHALGDRRENTYQTLNCAGLDETFMHSELFGHVKGAFTGASCDREGLIKLADGGTLFLDEIGELKPSLQAKLLRFIQTRQYSKLGSDKKEGEADVRFIFAGQPGILDKLKAGEFRQDFYYRIAEVVLRPPALREIGDDLKDIVRHLLYRYTDALSTSGSSRSSGRGRTTKRGKVAARHPHTYMDGLRYHWESFTRYQWPGNVRELSGYIKRLVFLDDDIGKEISDLASRQEKLPGTNAQIGFGSEIVPLEDIKMEYLRHVNRIHSVMNMNEKCERLGITFNTFKKYLSGDS